MSDVQEKVERYLASRIWSSLEDHADLLRHIPSSMVQESLIRFSTLPERERSEYVDWVATRNRGYWTGSQATESGIPKPLQRFIEVSVNRQKTRQELAEPRQVCLSAIDNFKQIFNAKSQCSREPGETLLEFDCQGLRTVLSVQLGSRGDQLRYAISFPGQLDGLNFNIESFLGVGLGFWDEVVKHQLESSLSTLVKCVELTVAEHKLVRRYVLSFS